MDSSRRDFLKSASSVAALAYLHGLVPVRTAPGSTPGDPATRDLAMRALDAAKSAGATYADVRVDDWELRRCVVENAAVKEVILRNDWFFNVRVIAGGSWGFASTTRLGGDDVERAARTAVAQAKAASRGLKTPVVLAPTPPVPNGAYTTPIERDPFKVPFDETLNTIVSAQEGALKGITPGTMTVYVREDFLRDTMSFASTDGSWIVQTLYGANLGDMFADMVAPDHSEFAFLRLSTNVPAAAGYEAFTALHLADAFPPLIESTRRQMTAKEVDVGRYDIVFDGHGVAGLIAASLAPALELDRVLGYEQASGTSFLSPPEKVLGTYRVSGPSLTLKANRNEAQGLGTMGWDSDGVAADEFTLIKDGIVVDYMTDRAMAPHLASWYAKTGSPVRSHGCEGQDRADHVPMLWWPNLIMQPAAHGGTLESMIAATPKGLYVTGPIFGLLDAPRMNGMYPDGTGNVMREITNGKLGDPVKHGAIVARTTDLWKSIDLVGGASTAGPFFGAFSRGVPNENGATTVKAPAIRVKQLNVVSTYRKERSENS